MCWSQGKTANYTRRCTLNLLPHIDSWTSCPLVLWPTNLPPLKGFYAGPFFTLILFRNANTGSLCGHPSSQTTTTPTISCITLYRPYNALIARAFHPTLCRVATGTQNYQGACTLFTNITQTFEKCLPTRHPAHTGAARPT